MALQVGDKAPEILGTDQNGKEIKLSDFAGKKLILYFYPKDNTSGCTAEACSLRDGYEELRASGYEVVGVSKRRCAEKPIWELSERHLSLMKMALSNVSSLPKK